MALKLLVKVAHKGEHGEHQEQGVGTSGTEAVVEAAHKGFGIQQQIHPDN